MDDTRVTVRRLDVPFTDLVKFFLKASIAAIPALLLLFALGVTATLGLGVIGLGVGRASESAMAGRLDALPTAVRDSLWDVAFDRAGEDAPRAVVAAELRRAFAQYERRAQ